MSVPVLNGRKLGLLPYDRTRPNVMLRRMAGATLKPPAQSDWGCEAMNTMMLNDQIGCCTIADKGHVIASQQFFGRGWTVIIPDEEILKGYSAVSGFDPATGRNDIGATIQDAYDYWRKVGFKAGDELFTIEAFAEIPTGPRGEIDHDLIKTCIDSFGAVTVGMAFPDYAMDAFDNNQEWDYTPKQRFNNAGGHDVPYVGYGGAGAGEYYDCWTWGRRQRVSRAFFDRFNEEFWTHGDKDWQRPDGTVPNGIDGSAAQNEFVRLVNADGPGWDGAPPVVVVPDPIPLTPIGDPDGELAHAFDVWMAAKGLRGY